MEFLWYALFALASIYISEVTRKIPEGPKEPGLEDFTFPTADATRKYPVIWGRPVLRGPNLVYYGGLKTWPITKKIKGFFKSKRQIVAHKFFIDMMLCFAVSRGQNNGRLLKLLAGDVKIWEGNLASGSLIINQENAFGGEEGEGGVSGQFHWWPGGEEQMPDPYLSDSSRLGSRLPAYRSSMRLVVCGAYFGTTKYPKEIAAQVESLPQYLGSGFHNINGEANPAEILFEILINKKIGGLGESLTDINIPTFIAGAAKFHEEGLGLTLVWDGSKSLDEIRKDIESHADCAMFRNVLTGKWELKLNRRLSPESIAALPLLDKSNCELKSFSRPTFDELVNEVYVHWTEEGETSKLPARVENLGNVATQARQIVTMSVNYYGITNYEMAMRLALRVLAANGSPLSRIKLEANREAYALTPLSKFRFQWDDTIPNVGECYVVMDIDYGTLEDNTISIDAIEDVFDLMAALYPGDGGSEWEEPDRVPLAPTVYRMEFTPYWMLLIQEDVPNPESAVPMLLVQAPTGSHLEYAVKYSDPTLQPSFADAESAEPFTPAGRLAYDYAATAGADTSGLLIVESIIGVDVQNGLANMPFEALESDIRNLGAGLLMIDNEIMGVTEVSSLQSGGTFSNRYALQVQRGLLDTAIDRHTAGAVVWFLSLAVGRTPTQLYPWTLGTYSAKPLTVTISGQLAEEDAPTLSITSNSLTNNTRSLWAYPVRHLQINGSAVPSVIANANLTVTWKARNRMTETTIVFQADATSAVRETDVVYRVFMYNAAGILLSTSPDLATETYTFNLLALPGQTLPTQGYVQVESWRPTYGAGQRATLWFALQVDLQGVVDGAAQALIDKSGPYTFWRMQD